MNSSAIVWRAIAVSLAATRPMLPGFSLQTYRDDNHSRSHSHIHKSHHKNNARKFGIIGGCRILCGRRGFGRDRRIGSRSETITGCIRLCRIRLLCGIIRKPGGSVWVGHDNRWSRVKKTGRFCWIKGATSELRFTSNALEFFPSTAVAITVLCPKTLPVGSLVRLLS